MSGILGHASKTIARVFARDGGEDRNSEAARASALTRHILESITEALLILELPPHDGVDGPARILSANHAALSLLGLEGEDATSATVSSVLPRSPALRRILAEVRGDGAIRNRELEIRRRDGRVVPVRMSASLVTTCEWAGKWGDCPRQQAGEDHCSAKTAGIVLVLTDITEIRRTELSRSLAYRVSELIHSADSMEDFYRSVYEILAEFMPTENFCILLAEESGSVTFPCLVDHGDTNTARAMAKGLSEYVLRREEPLLVSGPHILDLLRGRRGRLSEPLPTQWLGVPLKIRDRVTGLMAISTYRPGVRIGDTERDLLRFISGQVALAIERKREADETARLSKAVEQAADTIIITGPEGVIQYVNPAFERLSGYTREEVVGQTPRLLKSGCHGTDFYRKMWSTIAAGEAWTGRLTNRHRDGTLYQVDAAFSAIRDADGRIVNYVSVQHDVTHEVALEAQLRQSQKMEAVGRLAGGVAHDFNNILSIILGYCDLLLSEIDGDGLTAMGLEEIREASLRAGALTRQLLAFSRRQVLKPETIHLNTVIEEIEKMLRRLIGEDVELITRLDPSLGPIHIHPGQIEQVIMNLAVNARDAMPQGGTLTIETGMTVIGEGNRGHEAGLAPGEYVQLAVTDTGCGMDPETRARVFEPFFSTKEDGQGTGLGLSTVYGIVNQSGGHISVASRPHRGTTFRILLPLLKEETLVEEIEDTPEGASLGQESILVVEDEDAVRSLACEMLTQSGYRVFEAKDGLDALAFLRDGDDKIDLILTDVIMPRMGGRELALRLAEESPETRILFMSGYTDAAIAAEEAMGAQVAFLQKPFGLSVLREKVREVLDAPPWRVAATVA